MKRNTLIKVILVLILMPFQTRINAEATHNLSFNLNLELKILIIADTQDTAEPHTAMLRLLNAALDQTQPDLVVFLGDMIHGSAALGAENVKKAIDAIVRPVVEREIPFALVFGNHDYESGLSNEEQLLIYQSYPGCLAIDGPDIPGTGNYTLVIENPINPERPIILWFLDSGTYAEPGRGMYGYVTEEQNQWMLSLNEAYKARYMESVSYVFQHIPVPQVYEMMNEVPFGTKGAVTCYGPNFLKWYIPNPEYIWDGKMGEGPCSSEYDSGEFAAWKKMGVRAAFFGHDHLNDYCGTLDGIDMITTTGMGFYMYGRGDEHGARLITINANRPDEYKTQMLYYRDVVSETLPGLLVPWLGVELQRLLFMVLGASLLFIVLAVLFVRRVKKRKKRNVKA